MTDHPSSAAAAQAPATLDAHGFDPNEFEWRPVPRRPRADGWTPEVQRAFIEALARTGLVEHACLEVDRSVRSAYTLRNAPGGEGFARAWTAACAGAADRLLDLAFQRAIEGEEVPVYDQDGIRTGVKYRCNTRLTMFLLRAYHPDRFANAHRDAPARPPAEARARPVSAVSPPASAALPQAPAALPSAPAALPEAMAALAPVTPAAPHLLIRPDLLNATIAAARAEAMHPAVPLPDDCSGYAPPRNQPDHPRVVERAENRQARRARLAERERRRGAQFPD